MFPVLGELVEPPVKYAADIQNWYNTVLTPHLGYVTEDGYRVRYTEVVEDIRAFASGESIRVLNPEVMESPQLRGPIQG